MSRTLIRRFLVLQLLMLWQGGFLFYALVVVPIGANILGSAAEQGKITRHVTVALHAIGLLCLTAMFIDVIGQRMFQGRRMMLTAAALFCLGAQVLLHRQLVALWNSPGEFYAWHAAYLIVSGVQWLLMLAVAWFALAAWRAADAAISHNDKHVHQENPAAQ